MPGTLEDYATAVTNVISICRDAEQGFRAAADAVKQPALKEMFEQYSEQRGRFANELQEAVKSMGFDTPHPSGIAGTLHGAWMTVKGALTSHSEHAILEETERGEDWSLKTYREALARNLPVGIRSIDRTAVRAGAASPPAHQAAPGSDRAQRTTASADSDSAAQRTSVVRCAHSHLLGFVRVLLQLHVFEEGVQDHRRHHDEGAGEEDQV